MSRSTLAVAVVLVSLSAARCAPQGSPDISDADRTAIRQLEADSAKAVNAKDWPGWTAHFADDGVMMPPNSQPIQGRAAILTWSEGYPPSSDFRLDLSEIEGTATMAYARGTYSMMLTLPGATAPVADKGKYIEIWRKQADGSWKVVRDIFNSDIPMPAPPPPAADKKKK
jgi:uncharacterized protein (TIGR02246 family)